MSGFRTFEHSDMNPLLSEVADFRLSRQPQFYPDDQDAIWWSVLLELKDTSILDFNKSLAKFQKDLIIPKCYVDLAEVRNIQPLVVFAQRPLVKYLNAGSVDSVVSLHLGAATPERFLDQNADVGEDLPITFVDDDAVTLAVIDDGIAIAHDLFRSGPLKSRVAFAHIFDATPSEGFFPSSVGRLLQQSDIDQILHDCTYGAFLDEDLVYRETGQIDYAQRLYSGVAQRSSHGTHVMSLAGGHDASSPVTNRPIICSALPTRVIGDTTGLDLLPTFYLAFHILVQQARHMTTRSGKPVPVVFNLSYGNNGGPHDGTGIFASMFEHYFGKNAGRHPDMKAWLTLPAGNTNLDQLHAEVTTGRHAKKTDLRLRIDPDDFTSTEVQMWMPRPKNPSNQGIARVDVELPGRRGTLSLTTEARTRVSLLNDAGIETARLSYEFVAGDINRGLVTLLTNPTASLKLGAAVAPFGDWKIRIDGRKVKSEDPIDLWVRRDEAIPGAKTGARQAKFIGDDYKRFGAFGRPLATDPSDTKSAIRRSGTINGFACGESPIVVAAFTESTKEVSDYSGSGPLNGHISDRTGPDLAAKADDSLVLRGVLGAGSRSGSWTRRSGSSAAAPQVARKAVEDIRNWDETARAWSQAAQKESPVQLSGPDLKDRAGAGGIQTDPFNE